MIINKRMNETTVTGQIGVNHSGDEVGWLVGWLVGEP